MDTTLSKHDRSYMQYRYFVHCRHAISVFTNTNFSYGITVLGTPNVPLHIYIEYRLLPEVDLKKSSLCSLCWLMLGLVLFPPTHPPIPTAMMTMINLNQKKRERKKNEQQQIGRVSDLSDRSTEMAGCVGQVFSSCSTATNKQTNTIRTRPLSIPPSGPSKTG